MNHAGRADRVRTALGACEVLVVSDLTNVRWLTGFTGSNGWVVLTPRSLTLVTDGRYGAQAESQLAGAGVAADVRVGLTAAETLQHVVSACAGASRVGFEAAHVTVLQHGRFVDAFGADVELVPVVGAVESGRRTKHADEIASIERACGIADAALAEVAPLLADPRPGCTEAHVRNLLETRMRELGATGPSYETIVATGPVHAALPHHRPTSTPIERGHTVIIDVGALVDGYHSDMTRTFVVGDPSPEQRDLYALVLRAQAAGLAAVRPGVTGADVDAACRDVIAAAGHADLFLHGTGHGVGLLIHEDPYANRVSETVLQVGDVVTVEPGVYREGFGGIRIEDLVVVTSDGCRVLTRSPKDSPCPPSPPTT